MASQRGYDVRRSRLDMEMTFTAGDRVERHRIGQAVYTCGELVRMLEDAGLAGLELRDGYGDGPFAPGASRLVVVAERG